jgi:DNA-binding NarL/FixJ family response regulator
MAEVINLVVVDDDRMLIEGLGSWIADVDDLRLVAEAASVNELLDAQLDDIDVVLLDLVLHDRSDPVENVRRLVAAGHRVLVISAWSDESKVAAAFAAGARGYLSKDHDLGELASAVRVVAGGGTAYSPELAFACLHDPRPNRPQLSPREVAILLAYASGMTLQAAARHVGVRPETAKTYLDRVKAKYQRVGRPTHTKLDLANRVREDRLAPGDLGGDLGPDLGPDLDGGPTEPGPGDPAEPAPGDAANHNHRMPPGLGT